MAGKHVGSAAYVAGLTHPPAYPGDKENRAFAEGAMGNPASNPHTSGTPEYAAYEAGASASDYYEVAPGGVRAISIGVKAGLADVTGGTNQAPDKAFSVDRDKDNGTGTAAAKFLLNATGSETILSAYAIVAPSASGNCTFKAALYKVTDDTTRYTFTAADLAYESDAVLVSGATDAAQLVEFTNFTGSHSASDNLGLAIACLAPNTANGRFYYITAEGDTTVQQDTLATTAFTDPWTTDANLTFKIVMWFDYTP